MLPLYQTPPSQASKVEREWLAALARLSQERGTKFRKGTTAKDILKLAVPIPPQTTSGSTDKKRANLEIKTAAPIAHKSGVVRFMTNAGPDSDRSRHYIIVDFINFEEIAASAIKSMFVAAEMQKSPLKISCSCGRWRFWLAYLATIGGYNSGHAETAFPKIRNPGLVGIACKHILRVTSNILTTPSMAQYMMKMVEKARATESVERKQKSLTIRQMSQFAEALGQELSASDKAFLRATRQPSEKLKTVQAKAYTPREERYIAAAG